MGYLFASVSQIADFLTSGQVILAGSPQSSSLENSGLLDFQSLIESLIEQHESSTHCALNSSPAADSDSGDARDVPTAALQTLLFPNTRSHDRKSCGIEIREEVTCDPGTFRILLSNPKDVVSIQVPVSCVQRLFDEISWNSTQPAESGEYFAPGGRADSLLALPAKRLQIADGCHSIRMSFELSSLPESMSKQRQTIIPVLVAGQDISPKASNVNISTLIDILSEYPDPVLVEISDACRQVPIPQNEIATKLSSSLKSKLTFDFRDLVKSMEGENQNPVRAILHLFQEPVKSAGPAIVSNQAVTNRVTVPGTSRDGAPETAFNPVIHLPVVKTPRPACEAAGWPDSSSGSVLNRQAVEGTPATINRESTLFSTSSKQPAPVAAQPNIVGDSLATGTDNDRIMTVPPGIAQSNSEKNTIPVPDRCDENNSAPWNSHKDVVKNPVHSNHPEQFPDAVNGVPSGEDIIQQATIRTEIPRVPESANVQELKSAILSAITRGVTSVRIKVHPENLGSVQARLVWRNGGLSIDLKTENQDAVRLLSSGLPSLRSSLENANLRIQELRITVEPGPQSGNLGILPYATPGESRSDAKHHKGASGRSMSRTSRSVRASVSAGETSSIVFLNHKGWIDLKA